LQAAFGQANDLELPDGDLNRERMSLEVFIYQSLWIPDLPRKVNKDMAIDWKRSSKILRSIAHFLVPNSIERGHQKWVLGCKSFQINLAS